jgi:tetratricopeptide (TPR) repeat protein
MVPNLQVEGAASASDAQRVANQLRRLIGGMATHTSVDPKVIESAQKQYGVAQLDTIMARQLAQQIGAQNVLYGILGQGGAGLTADVQFIDVASGDVIRVDDVSAPDANQLAQAIFTQVEQKIEGIRQASFCNDYLSSSQFDRALETCNAALAVVPTSSAALYGKATALLSLERHQEALDVYEDLLEIDDTNQDGLLGAGLAASHLNQSAEALAFYNRYLELNPGNVQVRMTVASRIAEAGDYVSAFKVLEPAITAEENRNNPEFQRYLFSLATAAGQAASTAARAEGGSDAAATAAGRPYFETALRAFEQAFASDSVKPDVGQLRQAIAVHTELGNTTEALRIAEQATVQHDTVAAVWSQYASALDAADRPAEVARALTRVIELDADFENAYIRRGMAYLEAGQRQQGLADLQQAAQRGNQEQVALVLFKQGTDALNAQRFAEAEGLLETAARYAAADVRSQIVFFQGLALYRQGETVAKANGQGAVAPARRALEFFQRAQPLVQAGSNPQKAAVLSAIEQYVANQEAIIRAGSR